MKIFHLDFNHVSMRYAVIQDLLPTLTSMGYDAILWELEGQVAWETCPECTTPETWSKDQFRELLAFSRNLGLEPIPLFQTIGHAEYVMAHAKYYPFREDPDHSACYCVSNPEVRAFLIRWIAEYRELFGELRYFHLGGDEARRFGSCPVCAERDRLELYGEHIDALAEGLLKDGVRPGIWGDMVLSTEKELKSISHDFVIWDWNYLEGFETPSRVRVPDHGYISRDQVTPELSQQFPGLLDEMGALNPFYTTRYLKTRGYDIILCSAARSSVDGFFTPNTVIHAANVAAATQLSEQAGLMGHCVTSWAIRLNPMSLGLPLLALPTSVADSLEAGMDEWRRTVSEAYFGFEGGMDAADLISCCDHRVRAFSAVQWTGLKDGVPAPADLLERRIEQWVSENDPSWLGRESIIAEMQRSTTEGLSLLEHDAAASPVVALWIRAGRLQLEYLALLQAIFVQNSALASLEKSLLRFRIHVETFFGREQAPQSAKKNASLIVDPLREYLERR